MLLRYTRVLAAAAGVAASVLWPATGQAVIVMDPAAGRHLGAPTGPLANSGFQYQGKWNNAFLGTAIAPQYFITAGHVGGTALQQFEYQSQLYTIDSTYGTGGFVDDPNSDLRIWKVTTTFPEFAPLYLTNDEVNKPLVVFGRGTDRGGEVRVPQTPGGDLKGWFFGAQDGLQSWGENVISSVEPGEPDEGQLLRFTFDSGAGPNEAHLSTGDSGGGVFINDGGVWKLAGVNYSVDGFYSFTGEAGSGFSAAIFNQQDLWIGSDEDGWEKLETNTPGGSYATRIWSNLDFIAANTTGAAVPEPGSTALLLSSLLIGLGPRRR